MFCNVTIHFEVIVTNNHNIIIYFQKYIFRCGGVKNFRLFPSPLQSSE